MILRSVSDLSTTNFTNGDDHRSNFPASAARKISYTTRGDTTRGILTTDGDHRSEQLQSFDDEASRSLEDFFPGLTIQLDIQTVDIKEFFKAGDLLVTDSNTGDSRRFDQMGTGSQRAIQMALVRHLAESGAAQEENPARRLLLIDEPELYLHPQGVRRLRQALLELSQAGFQVIFSTHSPLMLERDNAADAVIVNRDGNNGAVARVPLRSAVDSALAGAESQSRALFELGNRSEIYFAEKVVLCEGKTDRRLVPLAYQRIYGCSPELDSITFVGLGGSGDIPKALPVLRAMSIPCCALADLDYGFTVARSGDAAPLQEDAEQLRLAREVLARLKTDHGIALSAEGLPEKNTQTGLSAADGWALMAADNDGQAIASTVHDHLLEHDIYIWKAGCIEHVVGTEKKGEAAIIEQEQRLLEMSSQDVIEQMPELYECFEWIRSRCTPNN